MSIRARARSSYRLRRWALAELLNGVNAPVPTTDPGAWLDFLQLERCAGQLQQHLRQTGRANDIGPEAAAVLSDAVMRELQRVLSARSQLQLLAEFAHQQSARVVVLKGGVALLEGEHADLFDVDVLASSQQAVRLADQLDRLGYQRLEMGIRNHLEPRYAEHEVQIEIHTTLDNLTAHEPVLQTALPLARITGLFRPAPADHLWIMLTHVTEMHPDRRSRLRDLLLIRGAWQSATPADRAEVERRLLAHRHSDILAAMLSVALGSATPVQKQLLERDVPARYLFSARVRALTFRPAVLKLFQRAARIVGGGFTGELRHARAIPPDAPSSIPYLEDIGARVPFLRRRLRSAARVSVVYLAVVIAWAGWLDHRLAPLASRTDTVQ